MDHMKVTVNRAIDYGAFQELGGELASRLWDAATAYPHERGGLLTLGEVGVECHESAQHLLVVRSNDDLRRLVFAMLEDVDPVFSATSDMHYVWTVTSDEEPGVAYVGNTERLARQYVEKILGNSAHWHDLGGNIHRCGMFIVERCAVSYGIL